MKRLVLSMAAMATAAAISAPASAALTLNGDGSITATGAGGGSVVVNFDGFGGDPPVVIPGLTSELTLGFVSNVNGVFTFSYAVDNTSSLPITSSRVSTFGMDVDAALLNASVNGTYSVANSGNVPNHGSVDFCATNVNCAGGGGGGVNIGDPAGTGFFTLTFAPGTTDITMDNLVVRYQDVGGAANGATSAIGRQVPGVPEPGTWMMMLLGFGTMGMALKRRRRKDLGLLPVA